MFYVKYNYYQKQQKKGQETSKCNLERDRKGIWGLYKKQKKQDWDIMMHQVLYNVHVTLFIGQLHNI